jgi:hypothetical protein
MSSFELNKVWRLKPYHNGTILEPLLGYRYMSVKDYFRRDVTSEIPFPTVTDPDESPNSQEFFLHITRLAQFYNSMHGGQLGARLFHTRGHWTLSGEVKFLALANFQLLKISPTQSILPNPEINLIDGRQLDFIGFLGNGMDVNRQTFYQHATQFCFGGEVRCDASYEVTRDINLRVGFTFLDLGQGIGRGDQLKFNNQAVQMAGVTFGFTVNR